VVAPLSSWCYPALAAGDGRNPTCIALQEILADVLVREAQQV
jgi:hypothetical protein